MPERDFRSLVALDYDVEPLDGLRQWVRKNLGINFGPDQAHLFADRVFWLCQELNLTPAQLYARVLSGETNHAHKLADVASTNYTFFLREPTVLEQFRTQVLPGSLRGQSVVRIWSAAAANGAEAYSLAMIADELLGAEAPARVRILATDVSGRQLRAAEEGEYPRDQVQSMTDAQIDRYFTRLGNNRFRVRESLRQMCTFRRLNLTQRPWPFEHRFHVIFLRNVLYYFDADTRRQVLDSCYDACAQGGVLFTSLTETIADVPTRWLPVRPAVFYRGDP